MTRSELCGGVMAQLTFVILKNVAVVSTDEIVTFVSVR